MTHTRRSRLVFLGMGLSLFAVAATACNVIALPYARLHYGYRALPFLLSMLAALALFLLAGRGLARADEARLERAARIVRPALILLLLVLHLVLGYWMEYTPMGDNHMLYDGAQTLARLGNFGGQDYDLYLSRFSNQWGFFLILTGFFRLLMALGVTRFFFVCVAVEALLYALAAQSLLTIARGLRGVRGELMTALMLAACLPLYLACAVLYTDTFSLPFVVFTLRFALALPRQQRAGTFGGCALLCGLCAFLGCQIKMTVAIVLIAAAILWLLTMRPARALTAVLLCFSITAGGTLCVQGYMKQHVLDPEMVAQHNTPAIHWVMMGIPTPDNPYGGATGDYGITWGMMEEGAPREAIMDSIWTRLRDRIYSLRFPQRLLPALLRKNAASQGDGTFGMTEMLDDGPVRENAVSAWVLDGRRGYPLYQALCSGVYAAHLLLAAASLLCSLRRQDDRDAIPAVAVFGMLLFLLLWEARSRYMFSFVPLVLLLSMGGALGAGGLLRRHGEGRV